MASPPLATDVGPPGAPVARAVPTAWSREDRLKFATVTVAIVAVVVTAVGIGLTFSISQKNLEEQARLSRESQAEQARRARDLQDKQVRAQARFERDRALWQLTHSICLPIARSAATVAVRHGERSEIDQLRTLIWGTSSLIPEGGAKMNAALEDYLRKLKFCSSKRTDCTGSEPCCWNELTNDAQRIGGACSEVLRHTFEIADSAPGAI